MKYVSNGYTQPNSNPKTLTTLTLTLTLKPSRPFKEFLSANPNRKSYASEHAMYRNVCLITRLTVILTLYDVNLTLANVYDAFEKNCRRGPDSNLKTINTKHATLRVRLFRSHAMGFAKRKLCIIVAAASMTSLRGPLVFVIRRPPEVPDTLRFLNDVA